MPKTSATIKLSSPDPWLPLALRVRKETREGAEACFELVDWYDPLSDIVSMMRDLYRRYDTADHRGGPSDCGPNCGWCCGRQISATMPEVAVVVATIDELPTPQRDALREKVLRAARISEGWDAARWYVSEQFCPFQHRDGNCGLYVARPLDCRMVFVPDKRVCIETAKFRNPDDVTEQDARAHAVGQATRQGLIDAFGARGLPSPSVPLVPLLSQCLQRPATLDEWARGVTDGCHH
jgi:Fe-S-cluster containining protein